MPVKKRTIAFIYHDLRIGGAEKELLAYMQSLDKIYSVHLLLTYASGELLSTLPPHVIVHEISGNSYLPDITHLYNLYNALKHINPDIVIGALQDINFNIMLVKQISRLPYKTIITEHIILSQWQKHIHTNWFKKLLVKFLYKQADLCIGQTMPILKDLKQNFGINNNKLYIVPNYVTWPDRTATPSLTPTDAIHKYIPYFLFVGRVTRQKNIIVLLHAYSRIVQQHKHQCPKLVIIGPHKHSHHEQQLNKLRIQNDVYFLGYKNNPWNYYKYAYATVIPSKVEGRCRAMVEAMMMKCPVISSNFTGHDDYITHNKDGLVFKRTSIQDLTNQLSYAITHAKDLKRMGESGYKRISAIYSKQFYNNYPKLIESAIQKVLTKLN